jgi:hypothetical protein
LPPAPTLRPTLAPVQSGGGGGKGLGILKFLFDLIFRRNMSGGMGMGGMGMGMKRDL